MELTSLHSKSHSQFLSQFYTDWRPNNCITFFFLFGKTKIQIDILCINKSYIFINFRHYHIRQTEREKKTHSIMSDAPAKPPGRPMKYPYTHAARFAQFPYKFYWKNSWLVRYWMYSTIICLPIFYSIQKMCK